MKHASILEKYGLFDAKVPRFTSYPPANKFDAEAGRIHQAEWLEAIPDGDALSLYVHIPFCRRLCWFCACRTQGTRTLSPVADYVDTVVAEIETVARRLRSRRMVRLHLGGGTPTLLSVGLMDRLLSAIHDHFEPVEGYEFSVEIDPTVADPALLKRLAEWNMSRASVGVQDFSPRVQKAIGRPQSFLNVSGCNIGDQDLLFVGTDDGLIQVTNDGGGSWSTIERVAGVPETTT